MQVHVADVMIQLHSSLNVIKQNPCDGTCNLRAQEQDMIKVQRLMPGRRQSDVVHAKYVRTCGVTFRDRYT